MLENRILFSIVLEYCLLNVLKWCTITLHEKISLKR